MSKKIEIKRKFIVVASLVSVAGFSVVGGIAHATSPSASSTANQQKELTKIQSDGAQAINARLTTLEGLNHTINGSSKLTSADKTSLSGEVTSDISGLKTLKSQLASDTTVTQATADAASIYSDYRVYALMVPKVSLVSSADYQLSNETKLTTTAQKLKGEIITDQDAGKNVAAASSTLSSMNSEIISAQAISSSVEDSVLPIMPSDWDANHSVLGGYHAQLVVAYKDNLASANYADTISGLLKSL